MNSCGRAKGILVPWRPTLEHAPGGLQCTEHIRGVGESFERGGFHCQPERDDGHHDGKWPRRRDKAKPSRACPDRNHVRQNGMSRPSCEQAVLDDAVDGPQAVSAIRCASLQRRSGRSN